ncbi:hypothetical protein R1sor_021460 [Riccia sorocarpa]|uniref:Uncharacterized protein n=1 Tax=Riccia sorocarpa TaxID=122646 RepID=A0ABD3GLC8_9MARC
MKRRSSGAHPEDPISAEKHWRVMVLVSRKSNSVLYIECGKDFVDILISILIIPAGAVLKRLEDAGLTTEVKNGLFMMYASLKSLEGFTLTVEKPSKTVLPKDLCPCAHPECFGFTESEKQLCSDCQVVSVLGCSICGRKLGAPTSNALDSDSEGRVDRKQRATKCSNSRCAGDLKVYYLVQSRPGEENQQTSSSKKKAGGSEKSISFLIKEDFSIMKSGAMTSLALLQSMKIGTLHDLDTREVSVGRKEVLCLVRAALISKTPLTDVFGPLFHVLRYSGTHLQSHDHWMDDIQLL